jgi:ribosomal protein S18 acetylase RimI-like enzyme
MTSLFSVPRRILLLLLPLLAGIGAWIARPRFSSSPPVVAISQYESARDRDDVLRIFKANWYWLTTAAPSEYSAEFRFDTLQSSKDPSIARPLIVDVARDDKGVLGFTGYYLKNATTGTVLYLAVDNNNRRKGVGRQLFGHALKELEAKGVKVIELITRPNNNCAQQLYKSFGFREVGGDGEIVFFRLTL